MDSSSSIGASQSNSKHDVFLNFRGEDTRCNFTSHLYAALCGKKIHTFIDDEEIERGHNISPTLLSAIERSRICITIFSQDYASSTWCLDELTKIIECKEKKQLVVVPVFYHVDPSHVRYQSGTYKDAFAKHEERFKDNPIKVHKWRTALHEAANSAGWDSSNIRMEADLVKKIVEDVLDKLKCMSPHVPKKGLVGITRHMEHVESLLCIGSADVRIIGIWGMGGIGKTTIAEALYAKISSQYEGCYFAANVSEKWRYSREIELRNQLLVGVLRDENLDISTPTTSSTFVVRRLQHKKLLIILDDVSDSKQIEYLVGEKDMFGLGSRIIVTTRNKNVFNRGVDGVYEVTVLNSHEALELFSLNAFQHDCPLKEYQHLSEGAVDYAKGIPLALKILGSHLCTKQPKEWESALQKLKKIPKAEIYDVLRLSYEGLDPDEQNIFLDIACSLKGVTKSSITRVLDGCGSFTDIGLRGLEDKSLVTVSKGNKVQMHDLIQEMGWQIVREESIKEPGKRSRLWDPKEIYDVLKYNTGTDSIESIALDTSQIKEVTLRPQTFDRMYKLRLLNFYVPSHDKRRSNVHISRGLECLPDELSYLRWEYFPLKSLPPSFCAEKLVELDLKHSLVEKLWDGMQDLVNLKSLYLGSCKQLIELPDLSLASKLEEVHLDDCTSLLHVPSSILSLDSLFALNLKGCKELRYIQSEKQSRSLKWLNLRGCSRLVKYSVVSEKLEFLNLDGTTVEELPSLVIGLDCSIQLLECPKFEKLPAIVDSSLSITSLCLDNCLNLSKLPENLGLLSKLNKLSLRGSNIENLPGSIKYISQLRDLNVSNCRRLRSLPELPFLLQDLNASNCISLETISSLGITMLRDSFDKLKKISLLRQIQEEEKMSIRHRDYLGRFEFYNCMKLDQIQCEAIMEEAMIRIQLAAYLSSRIVECYDPCCRTGEISENFDHEDCAYISRPVYFILPGNEVPDWFMHNRTDTSIITTKISALWLYHNKLPGFAFCLVLGPPSGSNRKKICRSGFMAGCRSYVEGKYAGTCIIKSSCNDAGSDQVWLWYDQIFEVVDVRSSLPSDEVSFEFFVRPGSSGLVVKQCGIRPVSAPYDFMQSSNEKETSREDKRPYHEFEVNREVNREKEASREGKRPYHEFEDSREKEAPELNYIYALIRHYACPLDKGLELSSKQTISGYHDGHFGKFIRSIFCATYVVELEMQHNHFGSHVEVTVSFGLVGSCHHLRRGPRYFARQLQDYYCYFGEFVDNINVFSSLLRLSLYDCNFESLSASIKDLSSLEYLTIRHCKRLMSLPKLPPSLRGFSVAECTSLETVELAEENIIQVCGNFPNEMASMVYEEVLKIQVTDPGTTVTGWSMQKSLLGPMRIIFCVAPHTKSLNAMCVRGTLIVTIT